MTYLTESEGGGGKRCCNVTEFGSGLSGFDVHRPGCPSIRGREAEFKSYSTQKKMLAMGFLPTAGGSRWRGKYMCRYCTSSGYPGQTNPLWWGHSHGVKCKKNLDFWGDWLKFRFSGNGW